MATPRKPAGVKVGVIGLGNMGRHHVRVLAELDGVDLIAVADPGSEARERVSKARRVPAYASYEEMLERETLDAVVVAVPTVAHEDVALTVMDAGLHLLVEKPLAASVEAAERIVAASRRAGLVATVGHVERYNPAVTRLREFLEKGNLGRIFQLRAIRTGPLPDRIQDVGVVVDLATHDLDIIRFLIDAPVERVFAECAQRIHSGHEDLATSLLRFADGTIALLDVNWLTPVKMRELTVVGENGMYRLDYQAQNLYFYENSHVGYWPTALGRQGVSEGDMIRYQIDRAEPLRVELASFAAAVRGEEVPLVTMEDGVGAVALAEAMLASARTNRAVTDGDLTSPLHHRVDVGTS